MFMRIALAYNASARAFLAARGKRVREKRSRTRRRGKYYARDASSSRRDAIERALRVCNMELRKAVMSLDEIFCECESCATRNRGVCVCVCVCL